MNIPILYLNLLQDEPIVKEKNYINKISSQLISLIQNTHDEIVIEFLDKNLNNIDFDIKYGEIFRYLAEYSFVDVLQYLKNKKIDFKKYYVTIYFGAIWGSHLTVLEWLHSIGFNFSKDSLGNGLTTAISADAFEIVKFLVDHNVPIFDKHLRQANSNKQIYNYLIGKISK